MDEAGIPTNAQLEAAVMKNIHSMISFTQHWMEFYEFVANYQTGDAIPEPIVEAIKSVTPAIHTPNFFHYSKSSSREELVQAVNNLLFLETYSLAIKKGILQVNIDHYEQNLDRLIQGHHVLLARELPVARHRVDQLALQLN